MTRSDKVVIDSLNEPSNSFVKRLLSGHFRGSRHFGMGFAYQPSMTVLLVIAQLSTFASLSAGCLVPPPINEAPVHQNSAPWLDKNQLDPHPAEGPVSMSTHCESYSFRALLTDQDPVDTLYWRVFLDYHRDIFQDSLVQEVVGDPASPGNSQVTFDIHPSDARFFQGTTAVGIHTVEILLSDRPFDDESFPPGRFVLDPDGFVDSFIWPIDIVSTELPCEEASQ